MLILGEAISQIWIDGLKNIVADSDQQSKKNFNFCEDHEITGYLERLPDQFHLENVYTWAEQRFTEPSINLFIRHNK